MYECIFERDPKGSLFCGGGVVVEKKECKFLLFIIAYDIIKMKIEYLSNKFIYRRASECV